MLRKNHVTILLLIIYARICGGTLPALKTPEFFTRDPLYIVELNLILPSGKFLQLPEEKRKSLFYYDLDTYLSYQQNLFSGHTDSNIFKSAIHNFKGFYRSYLLFRRLRI